MTKGQVRQHDIETKINLSLAGLIVLLFVLYMYFVCASVVHVVVRSQVNNQMQQVASDISQLDGQYMAEQNKVSIEIASLDGYTDITKKIFLNRDTENLAFVGGNGLSH